MIARAATRRFMYEIFGRRRNDTERARSLRLDAQQRSRCACADGIYGRRLKMRRLVEFLFGLPVAMFSDQLLVVASTLVFFATCAQ